MNETRDILIEIGTEELPPKALPKLSAAFEQGVTTGLAEAGVAAAECVAYAAPRRLALWLKAVPVAQPDREELRRGPALQAAFDEEGRPTPAAEGFARSVGAAVDDLERIENEKGAWLAYRLHIPGRPTAELLPEVVERALAALPVPKRMRWGSGEVEFVRPVHWVCLLQGSEVIEATVLGIAAGDRTRGHRFHHPGPLKLAEPAAYAPLLETEGRVLPSFAERREAIRAQLLDAAARLGGTVRIDEDLLDEVTALVEWPVAITGNFEPRFLEVPHEALILTMQDNQKYFPVVDEAGRLLPHFITIANIESREPERVREGNERVIRPRFADAEFFWNQDRRRPLASHLPELEQVVFQKQLGTLADKTRRLMRLAGELAAMLQVDEAQARRAAELSKCDLMTSMVYEFPELQGIMGRYYAAHDGEPGEVPQALEEQYLPRHAGDALPQTGVGRVLALADRLDTLLGIFAIGQKPSGNRDPFGLRRAALGILRILLEGRLPLDLERLLGLAAEALRAKVEVSEAAIAEAFDFCIERLRSLYLEQGITPQVFEAVRAVRPTAPLDFDRRVHAVAAFARLPEAEALAAANKRIGNILRKAREAGEAIPEAVDGDLLREEAERALALEVDRVANAVAPLFDEGEYQAALERLAELRPAVDRFFDEVMVMADDAALRRNRLALLRRLQGLFLAVADIAELQV